jgi:hypothetical protein
MLDANRELSKLQSSSVLGSRAMLHGKTAKRDLALLGYVTFCRFVSRVTCSPLAPTVGGDVIE